MLCSEFTLFHFNTTYVLHRRFPSVVKPSPLFSTRRRFCILYKLLLIYCFGTQVRMTPQIDRLNLISLNHTITRSDCSSDNYFRELKIEEDCSAIYQIYPRIICVYKACKIMKMSAAI